MRGLAALLMLSACRFGFDPTDAPHDAPDDARGVDAVDAALPTTLQIDIIILTQVDACVIGDTCTTGCVTIQNTANVDQFKFQPNASFHVVAPGDPRIASAGVSKCLTLTIDANERAALHATYDQVAQTIAGWSHDTLALDLRYHEVTSAGMGLFNNTIWIDQGAIPASVLPSLGPASDLVFITNDIRDDAQGLHLTYQYCGLNYGTDTSPMAFAYVWNPSDCVSYDNIRNYFVGEVHRAVQRLTTFDDVYDDVYPACGAATPDPAMWFPDPNTACGRDPDFASCGASSCTGIADAYHHHIFDTHWTRNLTTTLNHCADGILDYGETDVDTGGSCP